MKRNKWLAVVLSALLAASLCGCRLARPDAGEAAESDRLIGAFVTYEYLDLFDFDAYFADHAGELMNGKELSTAETAAYSGRLYATKRADANGSVEYVFEGLKGSGLFLFSYEAEYGSVFSAGGNSDGGVSEAHVSIGDASSVEGTLYLVPRDRIGVYINPVYQSADGRVYLTAGSGFTTDSASDWPGQFYSQTMEEKWSTTENGETTEKRFSVIIHLATMFAPQTIVVLQMAEDGGIVSRKEYAPDALPESIKPEAGTAYLIVETHSAKSDGTAHVERQIIPPALDSMGFQTFFAREDGVCIAKNTEVLWPES